jgi:hypothetical protein
MNFRFLLFILVLFAPSCKDDETEVLERKVVKAVDSFYVKPTTRNHFLTLFSYTEDTILGANMNLNQYNIYVREKDTFFNAITVAGSAFESYDQISYMKLKDCRVAAIYGKSKKIVILDESFEPKDTFDIDYEFDNKYRNEFFIRGHGFAQAKQINDSIISIPFDFSPLYIVSGNLSASNLLFFNLNTRKVDYVNFHHFYPSITKRKYLGDIFPQVTYDGENAVLYYAAFDKIGIYNYQNNVYDTFVLKNKYYKPFNDQFYTDDRNDTTDVHERLWFENHFNKVLFARGDKFVMLYHSPADTKEKKEMVYGVQYSRNSDKSRYFVLDKPASGTLMYFVDDSYVYLYYDIIALDPLAPLKIYKFKVDDMFF